MLNEFSRRTNQDRVFGWKVAVFALLIAGVSFLPKTSSVPNKANSPLLLSAGETLACFPNEAVNACNVIHEDDCTEMTESGIINWLAFYYCSLQHVPIYAKLPIIVMFMVILFRWLAVCCEDYLAPTMAHITEALHIPHSVAGVTLLAFANGSADILAAIVAITHGQEALGIGAIFGSAVFVPVFAFGLVSFVASGSKLSTPVTFIRDCCFLIVVNAFVNTIVWKREFHLWQSLTILGFYSLYVLTVIAIGYYLQNQKYTQPVPLDDDEAPTTFQNSATVAGMSGPRSPVNSRHKTPAVHAPAEWRYNPKGGIELAVRKKGLKLSEQEVRDVTTKRRGCCSQLSHAIAFPMWICCRLFIPRVDKDNWNWKLTLLQPIITPFLIMGSWKIISWEHPEVFLSLSVVAIGVFTSAIVLLRLRLSNDMDTPRFVIPFLILGAVACVSVVYLIACELVNVLTTFGIVLNIPPHMIGITVMAWGNSMGDTLSNMTVAKLGLPEMAVAAVIGGPIMQLSTGLGIAFAINTLKENPFPVTFNANMMLCLFFQAGSMVLHLIVMWWSGWKLTRTYGITCFVIYVIFLIFSALIVAGVVDFQV